MSDRDAVLRDLSDISTYLYIAGIGDDKKIFDGWCQAVRDARELILEQEPRVMTLEEVKALGWDYCYLEEERLPGKEYRSVCGDYALSCVTWPCITSMRIQHGDDSYGRKWRCWSAKPTDEQRKAVKWDADAAEDAAEQTEPPYPGCDGCPKQGDAERCPCYEYERWNARKG